MSEKSTYVNILMQSLKKKVAILEELDRTVFTMEAILKKSDAQVEEIENVETKREEALEELEKADLGFQRIYERVKEEFAEHRYLYEEEIKSMQKMIRKITDYTARIQAQEIRNKQLLDSYLQKKKKEVRSFKVQHNSANQYTRHLANRTGGQAYFLDDRK